MSPYPSKALQEYALRTDIAGFSVGTGTGTVGPVGPAGAQGPAGPAGPPWLPIQSATASATISNGIIPTAVVTVSRVAPITDVLDVALEAGTIAGQQVAILNESAFSISFAPTVSSLVAGDAVITIPARTHCTVVWDTVTGWWYPLVDGITSVPSLRDVIGQAGVRSQSAGVATGGGLLGYGSGDYGVGPYSSGGTGPPDARSGFVFGRVGARATITGGAQSSLYDSAVYDSGVYGTGTARTGAVVGQLGARATTTGVAIPGRSGAVAGRAGARGQATGVASGGGLLGYGSGAYGAGPYSSGGTGPPDARSGFVTGRIGARSQATGTITSAGGSLYGTATYDNGVYGTSSARSGDVVGRSGARAQTSGTASSGGGGGSGAFGMDAYGNGPYGQ